jgi:hypothetical protein
MKLQLLVLSLLGCNTVLAARAFARPTDRTVEVGAVVDFGWLPPPRIGKLAEELREEIALSALGCVQDAKTLMLMELLDNLITWA